MIFVKLSKTEILLYPYLPSTHGKITKKIKHHPLTMISGFLKAGEKRKDLFLTNMA